MAVLVTGGAGYIGSHVVFSLIERGEQVVVIDRLSTGFEWAVAPEATLVKADVSDQSVLETIFDGYSIDAIIHFAGSVIVPESVAQPLAYYDNNTAKSRTLIEAAVRRGISNFVFSSTAAVYGTPSGSLPVVETDELRPQSPYGSSKLMTEVMLKDASKAHAGFVYTALRYFNVAGCDPLGRTGQATVGATHLLKVACETALGKRESMSVFGADYSTPDGTCVRDYIHVTDLAEAHVKALDRMRRGATSIVANCGYGHGFSVLEVINCVKAVSGIDFKVDFAPRRPGDAESVVANSDLAKTEFNWVPKYNDLKTIVQTALDWEKKLEALRK